MSVLSMVASAVRRHYPGYQYEDVLIHLAQHAPLAFADSKGASSALHFDGLVNLGRSVQVRYREKVYQAVILAKSSDWYRYSLNCTESWHHLITAAIVGTHDSCLRVPVFALDEQRVYGSLKAAVENFADVSQFEERFRKTEYGHCLLVGALMCKRPDAQQRLLQMRPSTQFRIQAEVRRLHLRKRGRPLRVPQKPKGDL